MLKWTVNAKRNDLAENPFEVNNNNMRDLPSTTTTTTAYRTRRSLGSFSRLGKENHLAGSSPRTPLSRQHRRQSLGGIAHAKPQKMIFSPFEADKENNNSFLLSPPPSKANIYGAFRDVSNITPNTTPTSNTVSSQRRKRPFSQIHATPALATESQSHPAQYASTLPTFDIEYSPFGGLRHKPFLDSYFNQPRYITPQIVAAATPRQQPLQVDETALQPATKKAKIQQKSPSAAADPPMTPLTHRIQEVVVVDSTQAKISANQKRQRKFFFINHNNNNSILNKFDEEDDKSPTSADVGDTTLDHMIDAILESARKEPSRKTTRRRFSCNFKLDRPKQLETKSHFGRVKEPSSFESPTYAAADDPASDLQEEFLRCCSPPTVQRMDAIAERVAEEEEKNKAETMTDDDVEEEKARKVVQMAGDQTMVVEEDEATVMFNEREVKTPDSVVKRQTGEPEVKGQGRATNEEEAEDILASKTKEQCEEECALRRQNALRRKTAKHFKPIGLTLPNGIPSPGTPLEVKRILERIDDGVGTPFNMELANMDTPKVPIKVLEKTSSIESDSQLIFDDFTPGMMKSNELRASSTPTISTSCGNLEDGTRRCLQFSPEFEDLTNIERRRSVASSTNSRYGKNVVVSGSLDLAFITEGNKLIVHVIRCRDLQRPNGSSINAYVKVALLPMDINFVMNNPLAGGISTSEAGFQRTAVHRDSSRPYFDHRFIFELSDSDLLKRIQLTVWHRDRNFKRSDFLGCLWFPVRNVAKKEISGSFSLQNQVCLINPPIMCENSQSSVDEVVSLAAAAAADDQSTDKQAAIAFSKKAIHQRDADENLFLRFLELDPVVADPPASTAASASSTAAGGQQSTPSSQRRQSSIKNVLMGSPPPTQPSPARNTVGRTPFTITKRLQRHQEKGYGFSIVWTHPPRVEKVEAGLPADRAGILPGDFVIFVDKHNVVTMPELDILNLIRSQGPQLVLEIFRRPAGQPPNRALSALLKTSSSLEKQQQQQRERQSSNASNTNNQEWGGGGGVSSQTTAVNYCNGATNTTSATLLLNNNNNNNNMSSNSSKMNNESGSNVNSSMPTTTSNLVNASNAEPLLNGDLENNNNSSGGHVNPVRNSISGSANARPLQISVLNLGPRSSIGCSNASISMETTKRRLHLPQVTFSKESILPLSNEDQKLKYLYQLINREHHFVTALTFGMQRFVSPLQEQRDIISQSDHRTLFQNLDELQRISEDILEQLVLDNNEVVPIPFASRVYSSKTTAICVAYKKYCVGLKRADCVLVNKSRSPNSEFMKFITEPQVPRKRPDLTTLIHRPLQHFREMLKLMQLLTSNCRIDTEEYRNFVVVVTELQAAYREITVIGGLMEPLGEGRPLLTLQDLEARLVFTKCKPFILASSGRQWIFGGDLSRVEGRSVKPYWTLLFSDILLFAKVSRDRVLFITEEPVPLINVTESLFNVRKKSTEFRLTIDPNGKVAESPTTHCTPELTRTPKRNSRRYTIVLRAPSTELKAVWQNLLQRQISLVNSTFGQTPLASPLESPDVMQLLLPMNDIGATSTSMASIKLSSVTSLPVAAARAPSASSLLLNQARSQARLLERPPSRHQHHIEDIIDEKCRILNKNGTPKGGALHLAQWMKGQFDSQQQKHKNLMNAAAAGDRGGGGGGMELIETFSESMRSETIESQTETNMDLESDPEADTKADGDDEEDDRIEEWTVEQVRKRSRELKLIDSSGCQVNYKHQQEDQTTATTATNTATDDGDEERRSKSPSRSTTSDSQITVRSSPIITCNAADTAVSVCRQCHKHCKGILGANGHHHHGGGVGGGEGGEQMRCCQSIAESNTSSCATNQNRSSSFTDSAVVSSSEPRMSPQVYLKGLRHGHDSPMYLQLNGSCTTISSSAIEATPSILSSSQSPRKPQTSKSSARTSSGYCQCRCSPRDFVGTKGSTMDVIKQETCKIIENVHEVKRVHETSYVHSVVLPEEKSFACSCEVESTGADKTPEALNPCDPFEVVPFIAIVPPTPDGNMFHGQDSKDSPDSNESAQCDEPPYTVFTSSGLRRYGTMSSLEKVPSDERYNSSDEDEEPNQLNNNHESEDVAEVVGGEEDADIQVITKRVYDTEEEANNALRNWTARAGNFMAEKISFFEESRAFFDKYMGRWEREPEGGEGGGTGPVPGEDCTSGATSGEDVWGTPTSGGENDEMQMFNSDQTQSSPASSSFGDDDTELMMDELLMAPPMTASAVRGLLPRRRLEPLFEEDTESGESDDERTALRSSSNQGQVSERSWAIGRRLDSRGSLVPLPTTAISSPPREILLEAAAGQRALPASPTATRIPPPAAAATPSPTTTTMSRTAQVPAATTTGRRANSPSAAASRPADTSLGGPRTDRPPPPPIPSIPSGRAADIYGTPSAAAAAAAIAAASDSVHAADALTRTASDTAPPPSQPPPLASSSSSTDVSDADLLLASGGICGSAAATLVGMSPRLEMRLALNRDIMNDEDLINYGNGLDLATILGHDLSTYQRRTARELLSRSPQPRSTGRTPASAAGPAAANCTSLLRQQQNNSKMDTPTPNRKKATSPNTWSSFASAELRAAGEEISSSSGGGRLTDLERLARQEKMHLKLRSKNGPQAALTEDFFQRTPAHGSTHSTPQRKTRSLLNFLTRRNSENHLLKIFPKELSDDNLSVSSNSYSSTSNRGDPEKAMERRFWKQLSRRRRSNSASEISLND